MLKDITEFSLENMTQKPDLQETDHLDVTLNKAGDHFILSFSNIWNYKTPDGKDTSRVISPSRGVREFMQRFPEATHLNCRYPMEKISVPAVDTSAKILDSWPINQHSCELDALSKRLRLIAVYKEQTKAANIVAEYRDSKKVSCNGQFTDSEKYPLAEYQKVALHASSVAKDYALFMEMGTGKTAAVISRICNEAAAKDGMYRAIIVAPKGVRFNWECEFEKFGTCPGSVTIIEGNEMNRGKSIVNSLITTKEGDQYSIIVMNYETVKSSLEFFQVTKAVLMAMGGFNPKADRLFDLAVNDESHYIKSPGAVRSKAAHDLRDESKHRMILTGTPVTNHPFDLYMQFEFLGKGLSGFGSYTAFKKFFGVWESGGVGYDKLVGLQNIPLLKERLARLSFQIRKEEALPDLPEKLYDVHAVEMTKKQSELYISLATELMAEIEITQANSTMTKEVMANHILTKLLRLAQVTSGFVGIPAVIDPVTEEVLEEKTEYVLDENPKLDAILEILGEKTKNEKTIIWACFIQDIKSLDKALTEAGIKHVVYYGGTSDKDREAAVKDFNEDPETKVFIGNPATAGAGINLIGYPPNNGQEYKTNCTHVIYFSQNWSAPIRMQSEDRAHRRGTRKNVRITDLCVPNTIDVEIRKRVEGKREMAESVGDVREVLQGILESFASLSV